MHIERDKSPVRAGARSRRAARSFRPALEGFERRELLAAGPLGMNLASIEYVDAMKEANAWIPVAGAPPLTRDANGWPMSDAAILVMDDRVNMSWDGPDPNAVAPDISGTYHLSFNGQATISPPWVNNFTVQNQVYNAATNTTTADLVVTPSTPLLVLQFSNTQRVPNGPTDTGVTNVKLIRSGYAANTTQLFTTQFLDALEPFGTLRYMDVEGTNNYPSSTLNWSQRTLPTTSSQVDGFGGTVGESWEYMIELANETNTDMWINIPGPATDDYVTRLANLIKNGDTVGGVTYRGLNPNLKVYIEYSNEVWGGIAATTSYNAQATAAEIQAGNSPLNNDGTTDSGTLGARRYLERTMQVTNIFRGVFGAVPTDSNIRPVLGWQEGNWAFYTSTFPWFQRTFGAPSNYFYGMGNANYFDPSTYDSVDDIFSSLQAGGIAWVYSSTADFTTLATYYGLHNVAYEGGPSLGADGTTSAGQNALAALRDPRMEGIVEQAYLAWYAAGGDLANFYKGPYGIWGPQWPWTAAEASQANDPSLSPKYKGLMDVLAASPPAVTAGIAVSPAGPTAFSASTDSLSSDFSKPNTGQDGYWLLNVAKAGVYDLTLGTKGSGGVAPGVIEVFLDGQQVGGPISVTPGAGIDLGNLTLNAGLTTLLIHTVHGLNDSSQPSNPNYYQWQPDVLTLRPLGVPSAAPTGPAYTGPTTLDNGAAGYVETGSGWQTWGSGYGGTHRYAAAPPAGGPATATASWAVTSVPSGRYVVSATWEGSSTHADNARYQIYDGDTLVQTVTVNQRVDPNGLTYGGRPFQVLATVPIASGALRVVLGNDADSYVDADAVHVDVPSAAPTGPAYTGPTTLDNGAAGYAETGSGWQTWGSGYGGTHRYVAPAPAGGPATATASWAVTSVPSGTYVISATWEGAPTHTDDARYLIYDGATLVQTVTINQRVDPNGLTYGGRPFQVLATVPIASGALRVVLGNDADSYVDADAVQIVKTA